MCKGFMLYKVTTPFNPSAFSNIKMTVYRCGDEKRMTREKLLSTSASGNQAFGGVDH
ncbi:hypothetical protein NYZ16_16665 [Acinetobacter baumannii]|nr:hypothetical protein [Acinetobacter baumannii]